MNDSERCVFCRHWIVKRRRLYADGSEVVLFEAPRGRGRCQMLAQETDPNFGCRSFEAAPEGGHVATELIEGAPWQHWKMGACPDCGGRGSGVAGGACRRCAGIGQVRHYDDGHIGEERTRRHPKEPEGHHTPPAFLGAEALKPTEKASVL